MNKYYILFPMKSKYYLKWLIIGYPKRKSVTPGKTLQILIKIYYLIFDRKNHESNSENYIKINSLKESNLVSNNQLPEIDILVPAAFKDLEISKLTIKSAINTSLNPIGRVTVVVPDHDLDTFQESFQELGFPNLQIISEKVLVGEDLIKQITQEFKSRSGWVLAEFIKYIFVSKSNKLGILVIDADTILTSNRVWLTHESHQNLFPVFEYHRHYFDFLYYLGVPMAGTEYSYMSHYMLIQPEIYREMINFFKHSSPDETLMSLIKFPGKDLHSPVCFCYEAYSHFAKYAYPDRVIEAKWSNVQVPRAEFLKNKNQYLKAGERYFASISTHSYLK